jgi:hypothetical protein
MSVRVAACPSFITVVSSLILSFLLEFASVSSFAAWSNFSTVPVSCWLASFIAVELDPIVPVLLDPIVPELPDVPVLLDPIVPALDPVSEPVVLVLEPDALVPLSLSASVVVVVFRSVVVVVLVLEPDPIRSLDVPLDVPLCAVAG